MPMTTLDAVCREVVEARCVEDPNFASDLMRSLMFWKEPHSRFFADAVAQKYRWPLDIYDAYCLDIVFKWFKQSFVVRRFLNLEAEPAGDRYAERNEEVLSRCTSISASVEGGGHGSDGVVELLEPLEFFSLDRSESVTVQVGTPFSLEIGTTSAQKTWWSMHQGTPLARWPYGHSKLHLWYPTGDTTKTVLDSLMGDWEP
jgi:hypothetical protein